MKYASAMISHHRFHFFFPNLDIRLATCERLIQFSRSHSKINRQLICLTVQLLPKCLGLAWHMAIGHWSCRVIFPMSTIQTNKMSWRGGARACVFMFLLNAVNVFRLSLVRVVDIIVQYINGSKWQNIFSHLPHTHTNTRSPSPTASNQKSNLFSFLFAHISSRNTFSVTIALELRNDGVQGGERARTD